MDIDSLNRHHIYTSRVNDISRKYNYKNYKYYKISEFNKLYENYMKNISDKKISYKDVLLVLNSISRNIILNDESVMNIINNNKNIYFLLDTTQKKVENLFSYNNWYCDINTEEKTINVSRDCQGYYKIKKQFNKEPYFFTINGLMYDTRHKIIIDKTGYGLEDLLHKKIRIPKKENWINLEKCLYFFLLVMRGYQADKKTERLITTYFKENMDEKIIKDFIIKYVLKGEILNDKKYLYGTTNNLVKYIKTVRQYVDIEYTRQIIKLFSLDEIYGSFAEGDFPFTSYFISHVNEKIEEVFNQEIPDLNETYKEAFDKILTITDNVYVYGGTIRDVLIGIIPTDIDIFFDSNSDDVDDLCSFTKWPCSEKLEKYDKIAFGSDKGVTLEGLYNINLFYSPMSQIDFTVNRLIYDTQNKIIYDITGFGLKDIINKKIRIPVPPSKYKKWAMDWKKPLLFFKMIMKGFSPVDQETTDFIVSYIQDNYDTVYLRKNENGIPKIKHYLIRVLTHGEIVDNKIVLGSTRDRLEKYLLILKEYLNKETMKKIIKLFR
jgi:hypothetical protein